MTKEEQLAVFKKIVSINTVDGNEAEVADYIDSLFKPYEGEDVQIEHVPHSQGRDNLVITIGHGDRVLGFSGHQDVVDPGDLSLWDTDPFTPVVKNGKLYGRGACDMKSGLAAMVVAMLEMLEKGEQLPGKIKLLITVGEEIGNFGAAQLTKQGYADDLDGLMVTEPTDDLQEICYACKGVIDYHVTSLGKAAHSSTPEKGVNAIDPLLEFANQAKAALAKFDHEDPILGKLTHVITKIVAGEQINSLAEKAQLAGNIRTIPEYPNEKVYATLNGIIDQLNKLPNHHLTIKYTFPEEPMGGDPHSAMLQLALKVAHDQFGIDAKPVTSTGANDGQEFTQAKKDFVSIEMGPGSDSAHQPNEYCNLAAYYQAIAFYQAFAKAFFDVQ